MPIPADKQTIQSIFFGTWIVLFSVAALFHFIASPTLKRKSPIFTCFAGFLFLMFTFFLGGDFYFGVIPVLLIMFLNIRTMKYCPKCGAYNGRTDDFIGRPTVCKKCETSLEGWLTERRENLIFAFILTAVLIVFAIRDFGINGRFQAVESGMTSEQVLRSMGLPDDERACADDCTKVFVYYHSVPFTDDWRIYFGRDGRVSHKMLAARATKDLASQ